MSRSNNSSAVGLSLIVYALAVPAVQAAETVTHQYDALGRLKQTTKSGGPQSGTQTTTSYDAGGNRACQSTTGVPGGPATPTCSPPPPPPPPP